LRDVNVDFVFNLEKAEGKPFLALAGEPGELVVRRAGIRREELVDPTGLREIVGA
jgi:hypothetical protein